MKKSRFSEEQIIGILKQHEAGVKTADVCREHGISAATFYQWKSKFGAMDVAEAQRLKLQDDDLVVIRLLIAANRFGSAIPPASHGCKGFRDESSLCISAN